MENQRKVLFVTEAWRSGEGPFETLYRDYQTHFSAAGWNVAACDNKLSYLPFWRKTAWEYPRGFGRLGLVRLNNYLVNRAIRRAMGEFRPNLVVVTKGENVYEKTVQMMRRRFGAIVFNWNHDNPFWPGNTSIQHLQSIRWFHRYFCLGGFTVPALRSLGCEGAEALPCFYNEGRLGLPDAGRSLEKRSGLVFVGLGSERRANALRPLLRHGLELWGDWRLSESDPLRAAWKGRYLGGNDYGAVLGRARIVINVLNEQCIGLHNARIFEATGKGALLISEGSEDIERRFFHTGKEVVSFRQAEELPALIERVMANLPAYEDVRLSGFERTQREHLLRHRLQRIESSYREVTALEQESPLCA